MEITRNTGRVSKLIMRELHPAHNDNVRVFACSEPLGMEHVGQLSITPWVEDLFADGKQLGVRLRPAGLPRAIRKLRDPKYTDEITKLIREVLNR